ncbi:MAG: ABC transporter ATP-binding protein [Oscillospiraceae bacterium]|nr:ABC transporter ATP-binding protein [Oscillospiraceae bacterium]
MGLEAKNLAAGYRVRNRTRIVIDGAEFEVKSGEVVALIGPNGSGKTTLLRTAANRLSPLDGAIFLDGTDMSLMDQHDIALRLAALTTERISPALMTSADIVEAGRYPYTNILGRMTERDRSAVADALRTVHAEELADTLFDTLSDGQRQRVLLARAIAQEPQVMILDEPASYLDIRHKLEIFSILRGLASKGMAVIMSVHETDLAMKAADRLICVKGGHIAAQGLPEEIFSSGMIPELYDIPANSFDSVNGNVELMRTEGEPQIFVIGSCGYASAVYRQLRRSGIPFSAGILRTNDIDFPCAKALAQEVFTVPPFEPADDMIYEKALSAAKKCGRVISAQETFGGYDDNRRLYEMINDSDIPVGRDIP